MSFQPRPYQQTAIDIGVDFFNDKKKKFNALQILPTGSGKSLVIAKIVMPLVGKTIVFQPSKEILRQNYEKFLSYGGRAGIYSASAGMKYIDQITYATIGSVAKKHHLFKDVRNVIIDECHLVSGDDGMYFDFIKSLEKAKVLGLTATPYRLTAGFDGAMLKFLTRTSPRIFNKVVYHIQNDVLFNSGFLAPLEYYSKNLVDRNQLDINSAGTDFTDASIRSYYRKIDMPAKIIDWANRILVKRKNLLVFCSLISEAKIVSKGIPGSFVLTGETDPQTRDKLISNFKKDSIRCLVVCGMLTTGFDKANLEAVLIGKSMMSLALYYQIIGRVMRPFKYPDGTVKSGWVVDLGGNIDFFGKIETMKIEQDERGLYYISNNGRQLTNVTFSKS